MEKQTLAHVKRYLNGLVGLEPVVDSTSAVTGLHLTKVNREILQAQQNPSDFSGWRIS